MRNFNAIQKMWKNLSCLVEAKKNQLKLRKNLPWQVIDHIMTSAATFEQHTDHPTPVCSAPADARPLGALGHHELHRGVANRRCHHHEQKSERRELEPARRPSHPTADR